MSTPSEITSTFETKFMGLSNDPDSKTAIDRASYYKFFFLNDVDEAAAELSNGLSWDRFHTNFLCMVYHKTESRFPMYYAKR